MNSFPSDQPKTKIADDALDRTNYSEKLARAIAQSKADDGAIVVALFGDWGTGKTTIKNFTAHYLAVNHKLKMVNFAPWEWASRDRILDEFFLVIGKAIRGRWWVWKELDARRTYQRFAAKLGVFAPLFSWVRQIWIPGVVLTGAGGIGLQARLLLANHPRLHSSLQIGFLGGLGLVGLQLVLEWRARNVAVAAQVRKESLTEVRNDLADILRKRDQPVVIFVDDLDRLEPTEIRQVIALVKAAADLPRLVFVILCQRDIVARALHDSDGDANNGDKFLEKIIQVGLHIPSPPTGRIQAILESGIRSSIKDPKYNKNWDWNRWNRAYSEGASTYFTTLRHTSRYLASFQFYLAQHLYAEVLEVNPVDLAILEVLRLFEPVVFERLALTSLLDDEALNPWGSARSSNDESRRQLLENLLSSIPEIRKAPVRDLLGWLFPQFLVRGNEANRDSWDQTLRVCDPHHYHLYFQLVLPTDQATTLDFERLKAASLKGRNEVFQELRDLKARNLLQDMLRRFPFSPESASGAVNRHQFEAICQIGDQLPEKRGYGENVELLTIAYVVSAEMLRSVDAGTRTQWLEEVLKLGLGLDLPVSLASRINYKKQDGTIDLEVDGEAKKKIDLAAIALIRRACADGSIWNSNWLNRILIFWAEVENDEAVRAWLAGEIMTTERAVKLAEAFTSVATISSNSETKESPRLWAKQLERFTDLAALAALTEGTGYGLPISARESDVVLMLRDARNRKNDKRPYEEVKLRESDP